MSAPRSVDEPRRFGGWLEVVAAAIGVGLALWSFEPSIAVAGEHGLLSPLLLGLGLLFLVWGLRALLAEGLSLVGWLLRPFGGRRYRVHVQREAYIYMLILFVLFLGALLGRSNMLLLVFGLMAGPFVLGGQVTLLVLKRLRIARRLPEHAFAGERFPVVVELANRKPLLSAWMVEAIDTVARHGQSLRPAVLFTRVPPRDMRSSAYYVFAAERGLYRFGPMRVSCGFPLGLLERSFELGDVQELVVYPRIGRLTARWRELLRHGGIELSERARARLGVFDEEFHRLREYRGGDNPRAIHWRTTARRNELMVREYQHHRDHELSIVLDLWQPDRPDEEHASRVEMAISLAATIVNDLALSCAEASLNVTVCGRGKWQPLACPARALRSVLEMLALAEAGPAQDLAPALAAAQAGAGPGVQIVLITTRSAEALEQARAGASAADGRLQVIAADPETLARLLEYEAMTAETA